MNTQPTPISDRIVSQFRKGEATSDGLILMMVNLELKIAAICRELNEAREDAEKSKAYKKVLKTTNANLKRERDEAREERYSLIKAVEPLKYWRDISECDCSSPLPQGGCLRCDLNRILEIANSQDQARS